MYKVRYYYYAENKERISKQAYVVANNAPDALIQFCLEHEEEKYIKNYEYSIERMDDECIVSINYNKS